MSEHQFAKTLERLSYRSKILYYIFFPKSLRSFRNCGETSPDPPLLSFSPVHDSTMWWAKLIDSETIPRTLPYPEANNPFHSPLFPDAFPLLGRGRAIDMCITRYQLLNGIVIVVFSPIRVSDVVISHSPSPRLAIVDTCSPPTKEFIKYDTSREPFRSMRNSHTPPPPPPLPHTRKCPMNHKAPALTLSLPRVINFKFPLQPHQ